ncbi:hypothetical protein [Donghicola eburneus]|uniref:Uncharacterized protein n=1 Tax=Donghicola eburneus TaxID=393278 RepID=A0A1M4MWB2_9RHOB|nr:hypothetical protein [Donghicola eburneus]SCM65945.1 hypothetical protein KARMA_0115 [Donghicola eburneus]
MNNMKSDPKPDPFYGYQGHPVPNRLAALGNPKDKMTVSMTTAFRWFPEHEISGFEKFDDAATAVLCGEADALLVPILCPSLNSLWVRFKHHGSFVDRISPFVYGQFGKGTPASIVLHPAANRFLSQCPIQGPLEHINNNAEAPGRARRMHSALKRTIGFVAPDFVAQHEAPDQIKYVVQGADELPFVILVPRK